MAQFQVFACAILFAVAHAQHSDPFPGSGCTCDTFCGGSCSIRPSGPKNMTIYRMTPLIVDGLAQKNTGDAAGDTSYVISRRTAAYDCKRNPSSWICSSLVVKGDDPDSTDLVIAFDVEVDGNWGPYLYCNPTDAKHPEAPWACSTSFSHSGGGTQPSDYPASCKAANFTGHDKYCFTNTPQKVVNDVATIADCCSAATAGDAWAYTYFAGKQRCEIYTTSYNHAAPCEDGVAGQWESNSGHDSDGACECPRVHAVVGRRNLTASSGSSSYSSHWAAGGEWYSTSSQGECKSDATVLDGSCSWRIVSTPRAVNASCIYDRLDSNVERHNADDCFARCPTIVGGRYNRTSDCYSECYSRTIGTMARADIFAPWDGAFSSDVSATGRCPPVKIPTATFTPLAIVV